jgi:hypothetical protein
MSDIMDRRVLAGFRCVDAITGGSILLPLTVQAQPLKLRQNRSGVFAVVDAPGLTPLTNQFLPPGSWPLPGPFEISIQDASLLYLSRRAKISVPQPLPAVVAPGTTPPGTTAAPAAVPPLNTPQTVTMYPNAAAPIAPNWAVVRVSVVSNATPAAPLPFAVVQVSGATSQPAAGLTNANGDALIAIPGLGLTLSSSGTGSVTETTTAATVAAWFDPTVLTQPKGWVSNPDDILQNLASAQWKTASQSIQLGPGQTVFVTLTISL